MQPRRSPLDRALILGLAVLLIGTAAEMLAFKVQWDAAEHGPRSLTAQDIR